jgi:N-acetylglucosaminyldiphosphoundecaprenol N-acetyl-beta-D-mannosaminyltransferase
MNLLGVNIAVSSYDKVVEACIAWARTGVSRSVLFANVHMLMEAHDKPAFRDKLNAADMVNPDGMPLVWALRLLGSRRAQRVYGPDATEALLTVAAKAGVPVGFYGGSESALQTLLSEVTRSYPAIDIAFSMSPPFRPLNTEEDEEIVRRISESGVRWLFVGLGCPKQEEWISAHLDRIPAVMLGVGAAFDFLAGSKPQAPRWMMRNGLEWAFRLCAEPRRLAGRYFKHNPRFVFLFLQQWLREARRTPSDRIDCVPE